VIPPATTIKSNIDPTHRRATFTLKATGATSFQCELITPSKQKPGFAPCTSPKTYTSLKPGNYTFEARALVGTVTGPVAKLQFTI
jgi:hypothetical protein